MYNAEIMLLRLSGVFQRSRTTGRWSWHHFVWSPWRPVFRPTRSGPTERERVAIETIESRSLLAAAADYRAWGRVDDEMRWAPMMCRQTLPGLARFSASKDATTHGQKLYSLFARKHSEYLAAAERRPSSVGQVVVKESWVPEEVTDPKELPGGQGDVDYTKVIRMPSPRAGAPRGPESAWEDLFYPFARQGDKVFRAARQAALFVMMKLDPRTPDTDAGWVYATLTPDGKTVTSAGKIESCMHCHRAAMTDRLFGLLKTK